MRGRRLPGRMWPQQRRGAPAEVVGMAAVEAETGTQGQREDSERAVLEAERDELLRQIDAYGSAHMEGQRRVAARPGLWQRYWDVEEKLRR